MERRCILQILLIFLSLCKESFCRKRRRRQKKLVAIKVTFSLDHFHGIQNCPVISSWKGVWSVWENATLKKSKIAPIKCCIIRMNWSKHYKVIQYKFETFGPNDSVRRQMSLVIKFGLDHGPNSKMNPEYYSIK